MRIHVSLTLTAPLGNFTCRELGSIRAVKHRIRAEPQRQKEASEPEKIFLARFFNQNPDQAPLDHDSRQSH